MRTVLRKLVLLGVSVAVVVVAAVIYSHFAGSNGTANSRDEKFSSKDPNNFGPITRIGQGETSLDHGEKIAEGTREELLENCPQFRLMWEAMFKTKVLQNT